MFNTPCELRDTTGRDKKSTNPNASLTGALYASFNCKILRDTDGTDWVSGIASNGRQMVIMVPDIGIPFVCGDHTIVIKKPGEDAFGLKIIASARIGAKWRLTLG